MFCPKSLLQRLRLTFVVFGKICLINNFYLKKPLNLLMA